MRMFIDKLTGELIYTYAAVDQEKMEGDERYFEWMTYQNL